MKNNNTHITLGNGIYTVPDLALILQLPEAKVRRWLTDFYDERLGKTYHKKYSWTSGKTKGTDFLTLVEFYIFYQLRQHGLSAKKILEVHKNMSRQLNTSYPFASYELLYEKKQILYMADDETLVQADKSNQIVIKKIIETFCKKIDFSDKFAARFWPLGKEHAIVVDPHHQFGQPVISGTNINAETIYSMYDSGEPIATLGVLYDITENEVQDAIHFCKSMAA